MSDFYFVEDCKSIESFLSLVKSLGEIIESPNGDLYDVVIANDGSNARNGSFSHNFGYENFPFHTDTAYWPIPARLLVMWAPSASVTSTTILSWREVFNEFTEKEMKVVNDAIFYVKTFEKISYRSVKFLSAGNIGYRYDPNIMTPANEQGEIFVGLFNRIIKKIGFYDFKWSGSNALVFNNWEVLHGRSQVKNKCEHRKIFRAYVR